MIRQRAVQPDDPLLTAVIITIAVLPPVRAALCDAGPRGRLQHREGVPQLVRAPVAAVAVARGFLAEVCEEGRQRRDAGERNL